MRLLTSHDRVSRFPLVAGLTALLMSPTALVQENRAKSFSPHPY